MSDASRESVLHRFFVNLWYQSTPGLISRCLSPLSALLFYVAAKRRDKLAAKAKPFSAHVVVVGNITVGGTGKTPVIIALAKVLHESGLNIGIVSRGYGSQASSYPFFVAPTSDKFEAGDEALLIAKATHFPVCIDANRVAAVEHLLEHYPETHIILSDDGLQHYQLHRDFEIIVIDGKRGLGNVYGLPAGPLREPVSRLKEVDCVLVNGQSDADLDKYLPQLTEHFHLAPVAWSKVLNDNTKDIPVTENLPWQGEVKAVAAIGNPERFFDTLNSLGVKFTPVIFNDHHQFVEQDFAGFTDETIIMTSKDAVKCVAFAKANWWHLKVECTSLDSVSKMIQNL